jgi:predicted nucleic acid-binding protein
MTLIFIDTDILFSFFAINQEKLNQFENEGTTGDKYLDAVLSLIKKIEQEEQKICISEISILELACLLKRRESQDKISQIITKLYSICDVLPISDQTIKLSWYFGSNFKMHSGDAIHLSFSLFYDLDCIIVKDKEFFDSLTEIKKDYSDNGPKGLIEYFNSIKIATGVPQIIINKLSNLNKLKLKSFG